jgi:hypothetical protein
MLVTCCWPNCEETELHTDDIKDDIQSSRTSYTTPTKPSQMHHHVSTTGSHFDATIVSQRVPNIH